MQFAGHQGRLPQVSLNLGQGLDLSAVAPADGQVELCGQLAGKSFQAPAIRHDDPGLVRAG